MKKLSDLLFISSGIVLATGIPAHEEIDIRLSEVPERVIQAAESACPGIRLTTSEKIITDDSTSYELEGRLGTDSFELQISADGILLKIESNSD